MIVDYSFIALLFVFCLVVAEFVADVDGKVRLAKSSDEVMNMVYFILQLSYLFSGLLWWL